MKILVLSISLTFIIVSFRVQGYELNNDIDDNPLTNMFSVQWNNDEFTGPQKDDSDVDLPTLDMIKRAGYPAEAHLVTTQDGYILTIHRIPGRPGSTPVFLQHGLLSSSADWVVSGKSKGLAYLLADRGYDVWLGNARGNTYSRAHTTLSTTDSEFWNFSWNEMGLYDLPAVIPYVTNYKNDTIFYIGHSMGTTMFYVMASRRPEIADQVRAMISLAPVAYMSHIQSPVRFLAPFARDIELIAHALGVDEFLPQNSFLKFLAKYACDKAMFEEKICANSLFLLAGFDKEQLNTTMIPVILGHVPAGTSVKSLVHYAQEVSSARFQAFDYGPSENRKHYNSSTPPDYDLTKIRVPIALFAAKNDWLASLRDVGFLWDKLSKKIGRYIVNYDKFNHLDFIYGIDAPKLVYNQVFNVIEKFRDDKSKTKSPDVI